MVNTASSSMMKEGYVSQVSTSGRDIDMMKFCRLTIMGLYKKFKQFKTELAKAKEVCANANKKCIEVVAVKALKEHEVIAIQSKRTKILFLRRTPRLQSFRSRLKRLFLRS